MDVPFFRSWARPARVRCDTPAAISSGDDYRVKRIVCTTTTVSLNVRFPARKWLDWLKVWASQRRRPAKSTPEKDSEMGMIPPSSVWR